MPAHLPIDWFQQKHLIKKENGSNFYVHNTDSIIFFQEWAGKIPIIKGRKPLIIHLESLPACFHVLPPSLNVHFLNWISTCARHVAYFPVCLALICLLTQILHRSRLSVPVPEFCLSSLFPLQRHTASKMYNYRIARGLLEYPPRCSGTLELCDTSQPTFSEREGQTVAVNQSVEV